MQSKQPKSAEQDFQKMRFKTVQQSRLHLPCRLRSHSPSSSACRTVSKLRVVCWTVLRTVLKETGVELDCRTTTKIQVVSQQGPSNTVEAGLRNLGGPSSCLSTDSGQGMEHQVPETGSKRKPVSSDLSLQVGQQQMGTPPTVVTVIFQKGSGPEVVGEPVMRGGRAHLSAAGVKAESGSSVCVPREN